MFINPYDKSYYDNYHVGTGSVSYENAEYWAPFFNTLADKIIEDLHPKTVLDAGCAMGYLVAALRDRGVDAYGIDFSEYAISKVREDIRPYCVVGSLTEEIDHSILPSRFDVITNIEVLEHIPQEDCAKAVQNLCQMSNCIIFSSSPDDFDEPTHINVQPREYWAKLFAQQNFYDDLNYRPTYLTHHAVCYRRVSHTLSLIDLVDRYENHIGSSIYETSKLLSSKDSLLEERMNVINRMYSDYIALNKHNETVVSEFELLASKCKQLESALSDANKRLDDTNNELFQLYNSKSWKLTAPFRRFITWIKRLSQ